MDSIVASKAIDASNTVVMTANAAGSGATVDAAVEIKFDFGSYTYTVTDSESAIVFTDKVTKAEISGGKIAVASGNSTTKTLISVKCPVEISDTEIDVSEAKAIETAVAVSSDKAALTVSGETKITTSAEQNVFNVSESAKVSVESEAVELSGGFKLDKDSSMSVESGKVDIQALDAPEGTLEVSEDAEVSGSEDALSDYVLDKIKNILEMAGKESFEQIDYKNYNLYKVSGPFDVKSGENDVYTISNFEFSHKGEYDENNAIVFTFGIAGDIKAKEKTEDDPVKIVITITDPYSVDSIVTYELADKSVYTKGIPNGESAPAFYWSDTEDEEVEDEETLKEISLYFDRVGALIGIFANNELREELLESPDLYSLYSDAKLESEDGKIALEELYTIMVEGEEVEAKMTSSLKTDGNIFEIKISSDKIEAFGAINPLNPDYVELFAYSFSYNGVDVDLTDSDTLEAMLAIVADFIAQVNGSDE